MLDNKIKYLFLNLITSKYLTKIDYNRNSLVYTINNKEIKIYMYNSNKEPAPNSYSTIESLTAYGYDVIDRSFDGKTKVFFKLFIDGKGYNVPELDRITYAKTLDRIEKVMAEYEENNLDSIIKEIEAEEIDSEEL